MALFSTTTLDAVVADICQRCGLSSDEIDVSALTSTTLGGYTIGRESDGRAALQQLMQYFFFVGIEVDWKLKFVFLDGISVGTLDERDLGARAENVAEDQPKVTEIRTQEVDLPLKLIIKYVSQADDYQTATQSDKRPKVTTRSLQVPPALEAAISLDDDQAHAVVERALYLAWIGRTTVTLSLPRTAIQYDPGDVVTLVYGDGTISLPVFLEDVALGADLVIQAKGHATDVAAHITAGTAGSHTAIGGTVTTPEATTLLLIDGPLLRDIDDVPGYYAAAHGTTSAWKGAVLLRSADGFASDSTVDVLNSPVASGSCTTILGDHDNATWDTVGTLTVALDYGTLESVTPTQVLGGANIALVGTPAGGWEMIGFATATLISANTWTLSTLLHGIKGTDWLSAGHGASETFVLLAAGAIHSETITQAEIGLSREYKAVTSGADPTLVSPVTFTVTAVRLKPLSPVHPVFSRDGSNNLTVTFTPRRRLSDEITDGIDQYIDEAIESYVADIIVSSVVVRSITAATPSISYSAANQTTDTITPGNPVTLKLYQISSRVGRGYPGAFTG